MKATLKSMVVIVSCSLLFVACKNNNQLAQNGTNTQSTSTPQIDTSHKSVPVSTERPTFVADGDNTLRYDNGNIKIQGTTKDGKRVGEWKSYFESGKLQSDEFFADDKADGKVIVYFENGQKMYEGQNSMGNMTGIWKFWDDKGKLTSIKDYSKQPAQGQVPPSAH